VRARQARGDAGRSDNLIISRVKAARSGWDEAFNAMAEQGDDAPLLPDDLEHDFDQAEWEW
jgi:antitoxin MazE